MSVTLLVFSRDLRLSDHPALQRAVSLDQPLICLYCLNENDLRPNRYGLHSLGQHRLLFLYQSLEVLSCQLKEKGQHLIVAKGNVVNIISKIIEDYNVSQVLYTQVPGYYEQRYWQQVCQQHPAVNVQGCSGLSLFSEEQVFNRFSFPASFSKFRSIAESFLIDISCASVKELPPPVSVDVGEYIGIPEINIPKVDSYLDFTGGSDAAEGHLNQYFDIDNLYPSHYKDTRNALDGWFNSSRLSPWLANGCISPRQIIQRLRMYESCCGKSDSTEWIYLELLWREYFQWYAYYYDKRLFLLAGIDHQKPLCSFYPQYFKQWCEGCTPWPLVNACMNQLNASGFMSNRGRQIVASCLIYELNLDWRYGAAYFEQMLVDYDVGVNWGNWQYIAGVGADPRGGRHFNIEKQTNIYDPEGTFVQRWQGAESVLPLHSADIVGWPVA